MIKFFLNKTDAFLCNNIKSIFEKTEYAYKSKDLSIDLNKELYNLELSPFVCARGNGRNSQFEKNIKIKIRIVLGIFFVLIPLIGFALVTYILNLDYLFALASTFAVTIAVSYRMDEIAKRYVQKRFLLI